MSEYIFPTTRTSVAIEALPLETRRVIPYRIRSKLATLSVTATALFGANSMIQTAPAYGQAECIQYPDGNGNLQAACDLPESTTVEPTPEVERPPQPESKPKPSAPNYQTINQFPGYDMANSEFTSGNGCFVTGVASTFVRLTGDRNITPRSVYHGDKIKSMWSPGTGVKKGLLFDALPQMASQFGIKVRKAEPRDVIKALYHGGQAMVLFGRGYFTGGGHYAGITKVLPSGNVIIDDPNGKGRHGDSERSSGWSFAELTAKGAYKFRTLIRRP